MGLFGSKKNLEDLMYHAMSLMEKNQPKGAIALFNKIIKQDPKNTSALYNKGLALNQIKNRMSTILEEGKDYVDFRFSIVKETDPSPTKQVMESSAKSQSEHERVRKWLEENDML